jgi:protein O-GlcNAc transferase
MDEVNIGKLIERARECHASAKFQEASGLCREVLRENAGNPSALHRLGLLARDQGRKDEALNLLARAAKLLPESAEIQSDLGKTLIGYRNFFPAIQRLERALSLDPARTDDYLWLAGAYSEIGRSDRVLQTCDRAMEHAPEDRSIASRIAGAIMTQGRMREAIGIWRRAVEAHPEHGAHSALLFCLHYALDSSPEEIFREHLKFADLYETPFLSPQLPHLNDRVPERRLRVGYVSPDFRMHPVAQFLAPVLSRHDPERFEVFCYSLTPSSDQRTAQFRRIAGTRWRDIRSLSLDQAAELVRRDQIDILVDAAGHTGGNRILLFARKPAPVQITWLGYPNTTGLRSMDYRITDRHADPPGDADRRHSEKLLRLPCFLSYELPQYAPEPAPPPCLANGFVTFGSFNNFMKLSPEAIGTWARILLAVPESRLMLKHRGASDAGAQAAFPGFFEKYGIERERIVLSAQMPDHRLHLDSFRDIDIGLDPFPYNGTTTSCETLAMGVPVVALEGPAHVSRVTSSFLRQLGLDGWIARTPEEYVRVAAGHAASPDALAALRRQMRSRLAASDLGDPSRFTAHLEAAFQDVWCEWASSVAILGATC